MIAGGEGTVRRATQADADALADLYLGARKAAAPTIPMTVHIAAVVVPEVVSRWSTPKPPPSSQEANSSASRFLARGRVHHALFSPMSRPINGGWVGR